MMPTNQIITYYASLDDLDLDNMLNSVYLSEQVKQMAAKLNGNKLKQYVACRYLLAIMMRRYVRIETLPLITIGDNKRPHFESSDLPDFNISHSGHYVAVALATTGKVGLDIEQKRPRKNLFSIAQQFFSPAENHWLATHPLQIDGFWQLWTLREAALKLHAKGVWQMKQIAVEPTSQTIQADFAKKIYPYYQQYEQIHLSICSDQPYQSVVIEQIS